MLLYLLIMNRCNSVYVFALDYISLTGTCQRNGEKITGLFHRVILVTVLRSCCQKRYCVINAYSFAISAKSMTHSSPKIPTGTGVEKG